MVKNVIPLEHISRGITFLYMKKVAITNGSISYIPKNERQEWFMRTTFFISLHAIRCADSSNETKKASP